MATGEDRQDQDPSSEKPFRLSDYRDGFFQPNGQFSPEPIMSTEAIKKWEDENKRFSQGKAWGNGQGLFFKDKPLVFGRQTSIVDVVVDTDPLSDGSSMKEFGVSRRHFEVKPPQNKRVTITDLGSTNGVNIFSKSG